MMRRHYVISDHQLKKKLPAVRVSPCCDGLHLKKHSCKGITQASAHTAIRIQVGHFEVTGAQRLREHEPYRARRIRPRCAALTASSSWPSVTSSPRPTTWQASLTTSAMSTSVSLASDNPTRPDCG
jgi:hypothetical protein